MVRYSKLCETYDREYVEIDMLRIINFYVSDTFNTHRSAFISLKLRL
jgi:hypothetical protein